MLHELAVSNLGVIEQLTLRLPGGMIALTGETGAGKTLIVDAISLLIGGRADPGLVRPGADEATVDGRFDLAGEEIVLTRVVAAEGRSRAYVDGRPVTAGRLAELGAQLVDLHGQHTHQSLLGVEAQRDALDAFGKIDSSPVDDARAALRAIDADLAELGGDERSRAREIDLLQYQVDELDEANVESPDEDVELQQREEDLAGAVDHQELGARVVTTLFDDGSPRDVVAELAASLADTRIFAPVVERLAAALAELDEAADLARSLTEDIEPDPEALDNVQARRRQLRELCRKYGEDLGEVMAEHARLVGELDALLGHDARAAELDAARSEAADVLAATRAVLRGERADAAPSLASAIEAFLPELAMPHATIGIDVDGDAGEEVVFKLSANPGSPLQALSKVASGGELARTMLALRSVLSEAPPILVFDEVDAGIGGQAGIAVGRALAKLGDRHQILVVTHLAQVAAFADAHLAVVKRQGEDDTVSEAVLLPEEGRSAELARMLSGQPESSTARSHADELLAEAAALRAQVRT